MKYISDEPFPRYFNQPLKRSVFFFVWSHVISCRGVFFNLASCRGVFVKHLVINLLSLIPLALSRLLKTRFFFFQLLSSVLARKIMWFSRDAPVVYLHGIQCKLLLFSLWCFNSDFQMINSTKEEISRFWASVTFEVFAFISIFRGRAD